MRHIAMKYDVQTNHTTQTTVLIAGRPYLLKVNSADEALVHQVAQDIDAKLAALNAARPGCDQQDCFALALLGAILENRKAYARREQVLVR